jgi:2-keto-myo-inositol isomerase
MYTGGSDLNNLAYLRGANIGIVHVNDYPAVPGRDQITDDQRVFPGEGIAPTHALARLLTQIGYEGYLSLELFRQSYGDAGAVDVARRGLAAMRSAYALDH